MTRRAAAGHHARTAPARTRRKSCGAGAQPVARTCVAAPRSATRRSRPTGSTSPTSAADPPDSPAPHCPAGTRRGHPPTHPPPACAKLRGCGTTCAYQRQQQQERAITFAVSEGTQRGECVALRALAHVSRGARNSAIAFVIACMHVLLDSVRRSYNPAPVPTYCTVSRPAAARIQHAIVFAI